MITPVDEKLLNQFSFHPEAQLLVDGNGLGVVVVHNEINLVQIKDAETVYSSASHMARAASPLP